MNLEIICNQVISLSRSVGQFIQAETIKISDVETKSKNSLVTYVDKTAEQKIVDGLIPFISNAGFITEEDLSLIHI